tara:strand:+ start:1567 stop:3594 length:2028 start_codon:yes stop_codon:yes gene_type:complete
MAYENENIQSQGSTLEDNTTTPTGSSYPLQKNVISNQRAKEILSGTFNEVIISEEKFDSEKIKRIYNDLFYQIPKKGDNSHESIAIQSTDYLYPEINENLDSNIKSIEQEIQESSSILLNELDRLSTVPEHPLYPNGSILQEGNPALNEVVNVGSPRWYMQQGMKRKIVGAHTGYWTRVLRQSNGEEPYHPSTGQFIPTNLSPNFRLVTPDNLNIIPDGENIGDGPDFSIDPLLGIEGEDIYSVIEIELSCMGEEKFYKFGYGEVGYDYDLSGYPETGGYWYLDPNGSCEIMVERDNDPTPTYIPSSYRFNLTGPPYSSNSSKTVIISRDPKFYYDNYHGDTNDPLDPKFYAGETNKEIERRQGYGGLLPHMEMRKEWGPGSRFPAITYIKPGSRVAFKLKRPVNWDANGNVTPIDGGLSHHLYGIDDGIHHPTQANVLGGFYNQTSNYSTRIIHSNCLGPQGDQCYGAMGQQSNLQSLLNDPSNGYYLDNVNGDKEFVDKVNMPWPFPDVYYGRHSIKGQVYGQPILKVKGDYCVFIESYRVRASYFHWDWNVFMRLKDRYIFRLKNKDLDNHVSGYIRNSDDLFNWFPKNGNQYINNPTIYFPGLKAYSLNYNNTDIDNNTDFPLYQHDFGDDTSYALGSLNKIGDQIRDNPFNPKNSGDNYSWKLKSIMKNG